MTELVEDGVFSLSQEEFCALRQAGVATCAVEDLGEPTVVDELAAFVERFVSIEERSSYFLIATWIVSTYIHQDLDFTGYIFAHSTGPGSGKTTLLTVLGLLAAHSTDIQVSPTQAAVFRTADGQTQLFDEVDQWKNRATLRAVVNAGFQRGATVTRIEGGEPRKIPVYGPKAFAAIGANSLDRTTRHRAFEIPMVSRKSTESRQRLRRRQAEPEAMRLREVIGEWVGQNRKAVVACYEASKFDYLDEFSNRTLDIAEPLAAIVDTAFKERASLADARAKLVRAIRSTRNKPQSAELDESIFPLLLKLTETEDPLCGTASELAVMCAGLAHPPSSPAITRILRVNGFKTESHRKPGQSPRHRYVLSRNALGRIVHGGGQPRAEKVPCEEVPIEAPVVGVAAK